jgi:hypothetical protein
MRAHLIGVAVLSLALGGGVAVAQNTGATSDIKAQDSVPPGPSPSHPDQNATQEPSSKIPGTNPEPEALANGALTVPGVPADTDTVPAKFSAQNAADDKLPISAYTLKHLSGEQRQAIVEAIRKTPSQPVPAGIANVGAADVGTELSEVIALHAMPEGLSKDLTQLAPYKYVKAGDKVLVVEPNNMMVVGVFAQ